MDNRQLSDVFILIANSFGDQGEIIYKTLAYRKAAESLVSWAGTSTKSGRRASSKDSRAWAKHFGEDRRAAAHR